MLSARVTLQQVEDLQNSYAKARKGNDKTWHLFQNFIIDLESEANRERSDKNRLLSKDELFHLARYLGYLLWYENNYHVAKPSKPPGFVTKIMSKIFGAKEVKLLSPRPAEILSKFMQEVFGMGRSKVFQELLAEGLNELCAYELTKKSAYRKLCDQGGPLFFKSAFDSICFVPDAFAQNAKEMHLSRRYFSEDLLKDKCSHQEFMNLLISLKNYPMATRYIYFLGYDIYNNLLKALPHAKNMTLAFNWLDKRSLLNHDNVAAVIQYADKIQILAESTFMHVPVENFTEENQQVFNVIIEVLFKEKNPKVVHPQPANIEIKLFDKALKPAANQQNKNELTFLSEADLVSPARERKKIR